MTTTEIEALARSLALCAKPVRNIWTATGETQNAAPAQRNGIDPSRDQSTVEAMCIYEDTEAILGHLDHVDRQIVLDRSADIVAAAMGGVIRR